LRGNTLVGIAIVGLLLAAVVGVGAWWFLDHYQHQTREVRNGLSPEAQRNPLLAAERFLRRIGIPSESISGREQLLQPPLEPGLLLVHHLGPSLPLERQQALLEWVRRGGHLVITVEQAWDEDAGSGGHRLLDELEVQLLVIDLDERRKGTLPVPFPGLSNPLQIAFDPERVLVDLTDDDSSGHLLRYPLGEGQVTVLSDNRFLTNDAIGDHDHALLLALMAEGQERAWLLYSSNMPSLATLVWRHAPQLVISGLLLSLMLIWRLTLHTGPLLSGGVVGRPSLREHLQAAAGYLWRTDRARQLFHSSRQSIEQEWCRRHPLLERLNRKRRCEWIAGRTDLAPAEVEQALYGEYREQGAFIRATGLLQRLADNRGQRRSGGRERAVGGS
jgi:hypothetical protein